jgi:type IV pilus assembly protein PilN
VIRVNLLPNSAERRSASEGGQRWLLLVMAAVVLEIVGLFFFHQTKEDEFIVVAGKVEQLTSQVNDINELVKNHAQLKKDLEEMRARQDAINKLNLARKGPTSVLLELSRVLTKGKGPTMDPERMEQLKQDNPLAVFNASWDPRRVWLTNYAEESRVVTLEGLARDGGDVYEFAQRLKLSRYFEDVKLKEGSQDKSGEGPTKLDLVKFALEVKVKY